LPKFDTVEDAGALKTNHNTGSGFTFEEPTSDGLGSCLMRATSWCRNSKEWNHLQRRAMVLNFGWERSAQRYFELYAALLG
jgi:starch synthase